MLGLAADQATCFGDRNAWIVEPNEGFDEPGGDPRGDCDHASILGVGNPPKVTIRSRTDLK